MRVSRRGFLVSSAGVLMAACTPAAPSGGGGGTNGGAPPAAAVRGGGVEALLPTYIPHSGGPPPDYHSTDARVVDGYEHYPKNPAPSWSGATPGGGGRVDVFIPAYYPPPTPRDQNPTWQAVNTAIGADVEMNIIGSPDYRAKLPTIMASGDLPDIIHIFFGMAAAPNLPEFFERACADLTPYLAGDAIKDYPNLAAIPTYAWKNSLCAVNGKLFQWPIHRYLPGLTYFFKNTDIYDKEIGAGYVPKDADDFKRILQQLNRPQENRWAIGNVATAPFNFGLGGFAAMFGASYMWGKDASGRLVRDRETEPYKAAVGYARELWSAGLMWANAPTAQLSRPDFAAGHFALSVEGFGNSWNDLWRQGLQQNPPNHFDIIQPFAAHAGDKPIGYLSGGWVSTNVMKKASPERIKQVLKVVDWLAAPFGSQEDLLLSYGVAGTDYTLDANGDPKTTAEGVARAGYVPWRYIAQHPYVQYQADLPGYAKRSFEVEQQLVAGGIGDVTSGFYSKTLYSAQGNGADQTFLDGMNDLIMGRRPFSDYDQLVKDWRSAAGDQIRDEFTQAMQSA